MRMALALKRTIEASVVLAHPEWMENGFAREEVQAFSDFLVYALYPGEEKEGGDDGIGNNRWRHIGGGSSGSRHWSVVVFDELSGFVEVFQEKNYRKTYRPGGGGGV